MQERLSTIHTFGSLAVSSLVVVSLPVVPRKDSTNLLLNSLVPSLLPIRVDELNSTKPSKAGLPKLRTRGPTIRRLPHPGNIRLPNMSLTRELSSLLCSLLFLILS